MSRTGACPFRSQSSGPVDDGSGSSKPVSVALFGTGYTHARAPAHTQTHTHTHTHTLSYVGHRDRKRHTYMGNGWFGRAMTAAYDIVSRALACEIERLHGRIAWMYYNVMPLMCVSRGRF